MRYKQERLKDFPIDHSVMDVADTPQMKEIAKQITDLQAEYEQLREKEQHRQWRRYLQIVRSNAVNSLAC
ncbi:hypothetical protein [Vreelandella alkaliphila]|uniref:hypothetical protein n=1 Tax=Vreelandella alkaliphila TaxID=272774 RepID=UPI003FD81487